MRKILIALSALALTAAAPPSPPIVGGWSEIPKAELASQVGPAARFAVAHLPRPHGRLVKIIGAESQVVAGTNIRMLLKLSDGKRWRAVVWRKLDGTMELTWFKRA